MHSLATQLAPVLAAEKSKTPFYIVGGCLVVWAFVLALGIGMRRPNFPGSLRAERAVIAVSVTLVIATLATAVLTSGAPTKSEAATTQAKATETTAPAEPERPATPGAPAGSSGPTAPAAPGKTTRRTLHLSVPGVQLAYSTKQLTTKAGTVSIGLTNMSPLEHNLTIEGGGKVLGATPTFTGGTKTLSLNLKPGTYKFFCSVPGHRQAGMEGTLTVQ